MFTLPKPSTKVSARQQIDIQGVRDDVLILSRHRFRMVLEVSPINFELQSEDEKDAITDTYESFLNSVGHPLQVIVRTRELDLDEYLASQSRRLANEEHEVYRQELTHYQDFIRSLVTQNKVLSRRFFIVIPYDADVRTDFSNVHEQLQSRVELISSGLGRLGLSSRQLTSLQILELFYEFYNPELAKQQPLAARAFAMTELPIIAKEIQL